jgi:hypothetical protein
MAKKPPLKLVTASSENGPQPPRKLGKPGRALWDRVMGEYDIRDTGGVEMLTLACQALDRAEALREEIDADGEVLRVRGTIKDHPALKHELAARAFVVRTLARMGLNYEAVRPSVGRPAGRLGWGGE